MAYNTRYYDGTDLWQLRPHRRAIHTYRLSDGTLVGMFQGSRGTNPALDFIVRILLDGPDEKPEPPSHAYWVADLLMKGQRFSDEIKRIMDYYLDFYDNICTPFSSVLDRATYTPTTVAYISTTYRHVVVPNTLPIDYNATIIELFCYCEKQNTGAYQFRTLLQRIKDYLDGNATYMDVFRLAINHR